MSDSNNHHRSSEKRSYHHDGGYNNYGNSRSGSSSYRRRNYKKQKYQNYSDSSSYTNNSTNSSSNDDNNGSSNNNTTTSSSSYSTGGGNYYNNENYISKYPFAIRNVTDYINQLSSNTSSSSDNLNTTNDNNNNNTTTSSSTNNNNLDNNLNNNLNNNNLDNNNLDNNLNNSSQNVIRNYFSNSKKYRKIPKGWPQVTPLFGELIPNTKFIPLKCPLSPQYFKYPNNSSISLIQEHFNTKYEQDIGLIIDLCCVEFYKKNDLPLNMKYLSYYMNIHDLNKNLNVKLFTEQMDTIVNDIDLYISNNPTKYILIHCTHGLNRTGFVICYYLLKKKIIENVEKAIEIFKIHRMTRTGLYNPFFIDLLFEMFDQTNSEMYQLMKYPDPIQHSRKSIRKELKFYKPWLKRNNHLECFKHYHILKSINLLNKNDNNDDNKDDNNNDNDNEEEMKKNISKSDNDDSSTRLSDDLDSLNSDKEEEEDLEEIDDEEMTRK
ncbi:predicted protein [Naegleria gruberi]|uniref:Predicted protein n=1 Tax=Naegleria gruberi TaxID=5762 RepID=D2W4L5_NAEGR|nr:uncharacterized protein NAEGRDRAFT_76349 [Naegleria gruberi]EFC35984.1 predicted protein [Naegleria gruberi]|eukprot:XP_002668728.1 predicted protein [Naegleria gruberi strain NEG-M]